MLLGKVQFLQKVANGCYCNFWFRYRSMGMTRKLLLSHDLSTYFLGGYTRLQGGRWSDSRALSCVERFDTFSHYWTTVSSLHQARSGLGVAVVGGMVYAIGGNN